MTDPIMQQALEQAIRADEKANSALKQIGSLALEMGAMRTEVSALQVSVGKLIVKTAIASALGSLIGGGAIAVLVALISTHVSG